MRGVLHGKQQTLICNIMDENACVTATSAFLKKILVSHEAIVSLSVECVLEQIALKHDLNLVKLKDEYVPYAIQHVLHDIRSAYQDTLCKGKNIKGKPCPFRACLNGYCARHAKQYDRTRIVSDVNRYKSSRKLLHKDAEVQTHNDKEQDPMSSQSDSLQQNEHIVNPTPDMESRIKQRSTTPPRNRRAFRIDDD